MIARATAPDPSHRFEDLASFAEALAPAPNAPRSSRRLPATLAALALLGLGVLALSRGGSSTDDTSRGTAADSETGASDPAWIVALTRGSDRPDARESQRRGLYAYRTGDDGGALAGFEGALAIDPTYGAAELGLAMIYAQGTIHEARPHLARAVAARSRLSEGARALLEALRPCVEDDPIDPARCEASLLAAATAHPDSPLLWYELARQRRHREGFSDAIVDAFERALAIEPELGLALVAQAQTLAYLGRFEEALAMTERCLEAVPTSTSCHRDRVWIQQALGDCEAVEVSARRWRAVDPENPHPHWALAGVADQRGEHEVAAQLLADARTRSGERRPFFEARDPILLAIARGDFDSAARDLNLFDARAFATTGALASDRAARMVPDRLSILVALEMGDPARAASIAESALARMEAWPADPRVEDFGIAHDATPFLLDVLRETHAIDDVTRAARREAWLEGWRARTSTPYVPFLWLNGFAMHVDDAFEAHEAAEAGRSVVPPPFHPLAFPALGLGRLAHFEGRDDEAITSLTQAAEACGAPGLDGAHETWWQRPRAALALGEILEAGGDHEGACTRYADVLARWGDAHPRSVTADRARERHEALGCGP